MDARDAAAAKASTTVASAPVVVAEVVATVEPPPAVAPVEVVSDLGDDNFVPLPPAPGSEEPTPDELAQTPVAVAPAAETVLNPDIWGEVVFVTAGSGLPLPELGAQATESKTPPVDGSWPFAAEFGMDYRTPPVEASEEPTPREVARQVSDLLDQLEATGTRPTGATAELLELLVAGYERATDLPTPEGVATTFGGRRVPFDLFEGIAAPGTDGAELGSTEVKSVFGGRSGERLTAGAQQALQRLERARRLPAAFRAGLDENGPHRTAGELDWTVPGRSIRIAETATAESDGQPDAPKTSTASRTLPSAPKRRRGAAGNGGSMRERRAMAPERSEKLAFAAGSF
jgi:hypothetical protein